MKKKVVFGIFVVLLFIAGGFFFFPKKPAKAAVLESFLPVRPIFYLRVNDLGLRVEKLMSTKMANQIKNLDYKEIAALMGFGSSEVDTARDKLSGIFSPESQKIFKALLGREFVLAVYTDNDAKGFQAQSPQDARKVIMELAQNVFIATRVSPDFAFVETFLKFAGQSAKDFKTTTTRYNGRDINTIASQDGSVTVSYVRFKDVMIIGAGEKAAKSAVDVFAKKQKSLVFDEEFLSRRKSLSAESDTIGFLDVSRIHEIGKQQINEMIKASPSEANARQLKDSLKQTEGLQHLVLDALTGNIWTGKAELYFDKVKLDPSMQSFYTCAPQKNRSLKFVPANTFFYQWNSCWDFPLLWSQYKDQVALQSQLQGRPFDVEQFIGSYEKMVGLSVENDIFPALGKEFGIYLTDVDVSGNFPLPKLVVFMQITQREKVTALIEKLMALDPNLRLQDETYAGQLIRYIPIPLSDNFNVGYTFVDNYLLLASDIDILKFSLDAAENPAVSIAANSAFGPAVTDNNSVFYIQVDRLMSELTSLLDWGLKISAQTKVQRQAFLSGSQKNIDGIKERNEVLNAQIKTKQQNLSLLPDSADPASEIALQKEKLQKEIESDQKEIVVNQERSKKLSQQMEDYRAQTPAEDQQVKLGESFVKPFLSALSNIRYFLTYTINGDGVLKSMMYLKVE